MSKKKLNNLSRTSYILVFVTGWLIGYGIIEAIKPRPVYTPNPQAVQNTAKNAFISGCKPAVGDGFSDSQKEQYCGCSYDKLVGLYGVEFYNDSNLVNRIRTEGFNLKETEEITKCVSNV